MEMDETALLYSFVSNASTTTMAAAEAAAQGDSSSEMANVIAVVVPIFFGIIAVTGFFGNSLVILVVLANPQMRSTTNLLIVNLAIADLLFVVFCIPFSAADYIFEIWPFGTAWCKIVQYLIVVTVLASIYTLVLMSLDRFLAVVHPIASRSIRTERNTKLAICTLWTVIVVAALPVGFVHGTITDSIEGSTWVLCQFIENDLLSRATYTAAFMVSSFMLPLIIISGLYMCMITRLWQVGAGTSSGDGTARMSAVSQRGRKRVTRLVVVVVVAFAALWFPIQLILLLKSLDLYYADSTFTVMLQIVSQVVAYCSSCINPLLYAFLSDNFRKAFQKVVKCTSRYRDYSSNLPTQRRISQAGRTSTTGI